MSSPLARAVRSFNSFTKAAEDSAMRTIHAAASGAAAAAAAASGAAVPPAFYVAGTLVGIVPAFALEALCTAPSDVFTVGPTGISINAALTTYEARSEAVAGVLAEWRAARRFECLAGWRNERYDVFGPDTTPLVAIERAAVGLFGVRTFGCHLNGYIRLPSPDPLASPASSIRMWVARRSYKKPTNPGMLDNIVGGGLPSGASPTPNIIKESLEEAGIPAEIARHAVPVGISSVWMYSPVRGVIPDTEYCYDLELDPAFVPSPADGEVHEFFLWDLPTVKKHIEAGEFTGEAGSVIVDFMIRHGFVTPESEPNYLEIVNELRRPLIFPGPSHSH
ncbi:hypothetical protein HK105_202174 [Polyrhizophydium stewartii]|uniref:Nudix hydrolase domain-containing protein n=1 Tax=Polyrhizophydium stewartii TaxID=2732419 RepID=A0ABR4NFE2_9FUNG